MLLHITGFLSILGLNTFPCVWADYVLFINLSISGHLVASTSWLLGIIKMNTDVQISLFDTLLSIVLGINTKVRLLITE